MFLCEQDHPFILDNAPIMATEIEEFILLFNLVLLKGLFFINNLDLIN